MKETMQWEILVCWKEDNNSKVIWMTRKTWGIQLWLTIVSIPMIRKIIIVGYSMIEDIVTLTQCKNPDMIYEAEIDQT